MKNLTSALTSRPQVAKWSLPLLFLACSFLSTQAQAITLYPNACLSTVVPPCYVASLSGPVLITDPSQVAFQIITNVGIGIEGYSTQLSSFGVTSDYIDASGALAANPDAALQQNQNNTAALMLSGGAPVAPNPGGSVVTTNSTTSYTVGFADTPVTQRIDQYSTTIEAILNGGSTVFSQTFSLPFGDSTVQAAVAQADAILAGDGASVGRLTALSTPPH